MKLTVFFATDGDCLLLSSSDEHHALIDGGRGASFREQTWPVLQAMAKAEREVDLVVVSHIDADHISGILWLIRCVADWAVYDYQSTDGANPGFPEPDVTRPPTIGKVWHNSWRAQLGDLSGPIEALAAQVSEALAMRGFDPTTATGATALMFGAIEDLVQSIPQAVELRHLVDDETPIPRNVPFGDLVLLKDPPHVEALGRTELTVIGPARKYLERLQEEWREWIGRSAVAARSLDEPLGRGTGELGNASAAAPAVEGSQAELISSLAAAAEVIVMTDPTKVTPPNRASIILLAEEGERTCLLTGDAAEEEILEGLEAAGRFEDGPFRCNVLKVQHHGSEHNLSKNFADRVVADHYIFSGDGAHGNPEPSVIRTLAEARRDSTPFTLWFTCHPDRAIASRQGAMRAAISEARAAAKEHAHMTVKVLDEDEPYVEIDV